MLAQRESRASHKLLQLLGKRLRVMLRVGLVLATCCALAAVAFSIWWLTSLNGLPDIGDPFDVTAFRASAFPTIKMRSHFFGEQRRSSPPFGGQRGERGPTRTN